MGKKKMKMTWSDKGKGKKKRSKKPKSINVITVIVIIIGISTLAIWIFLRKPATTENNQPVTVRVMTEQKFYSPLTGREIENEGISKRPVVAVMIENSRDARPQSGLVDAGVVFEAIAEGGITRFVALYQEAEPELVGPIRSARPYYLDWMAAFDPAIIHVGGSDEALGMLRTGRYGLDIDEIDQSVIFRVEERYAPHNAYANFAKYSTYIEKKGKNTSEFTSWNRQDGQSWRCECPPEIICECAESAIAGSIDIGISNGDFMVHYDYDVDTNTYKRSIGGRPHMDREKGQISPDVVIALRSNYGIMADGVHSTYQTIGENEVYIFQNGGVIKGTWKKTDTKSQIKFFDNEGEEIKLNRGQVWITAVEQGKDVLWSQ